MSEISLRCPEVPLFPSAWRMWMRHRWWPTIVSPSIHEEEAGMAAVAYSTINCERASPRQGCTSPHKSSPPPSTLFRSWWSVLASWMAAWHFSNSNWMQKRICGPPLSLIHRHRRRVVDAASGGAREKGMEGQRCGGPHPRSGWHHQCKSFRWRRPLMSSRYITGASVLEI